jgi:hypothetical protein
LAVWVCGFIFHLQVLAAETPFEAAMRISNHTKVEQHMGWEDAEAEESIWGIEGVEWIPVGIRREDGHSAARKITRRKGKPLQYCTEREKTQLRIREVRYCRAPEG